MSPVICLSGWAQRHDALAEILPDADHLDYYPNTTPEAVLEQLIAYRDTHRLAVGWSLGGWLLMQAASQGILALEKLVVIAPPLQFVNTDDFTQGMDTITFDLFYQNYRDAPERTSARFTALMAKGDKHHRQVMEAIDLPHHTAHAEVWHPWLDVLAAMRHDDIAFDALPPTLVIHGREDTVVPFVQGEMLAAALPDGRLLAFDDCAHVPHMHHPERVREAITTFLGI